MNATVKKHAKLTRSMDQEGYCWASGDGTTWIIIKGDYWPSCGRKKVFYTATNSAQGITFDTDTLKEMRVRLPQVDEAYLPDGTLLADVSKTLKRIERERKARPNEEKLEAADKKVIEDIKGRMKSAQHDYDQFVDKMNKGGIEGFAKVLRWNGDVVRQSFLMQYYTSLLDTEGAFTPGGRLERISHRHHACHNQMMEASFHDVDCNGDFKRGVLREKNRAVVQFFHVLDALLRIYKDEYVESESLAKPFKTSRWA